MPLIFYELLCDYNSWSLNHCSQTETQPRSDSVQCNAQSFVRLKFKTRHSEQTSLTGVELYPSSAMKNTMTSDSSMLRAKCSLWSGSHNIRLSLSVHTVHQGHTIYRVMCMSRSISAFTCVEETFLEAGPVTVWWPFVFLSYCYIIDLHTRCKNSVLTAGNTTFFF